jgi:hypothetical protein
MLIESLTFRTALSGFLVFGDWKVERSPLLKMVLDKGL